MARLDAKLRETIEQVVNDLKASGFDNVQPVRIQSSDDEIIDLVASKCQKREAAIKAGRPCRLSADEFASSIGPREWIVDDLIPAGAGLVLIFGKSTAGKSYWTLDLATAITRGTSWRDKDTRKNRVLYVCAEGAHDFKYRMRALAQSAQCGLDELPDIYPGAPDLLDADQFSKLMADAIWPGDVVVLDTLAQTMTGDENGQGMPAYIRRCGEIYAKTGKPVIVLHHPGKDQSKGARGHSSLLAACDVVIRIDEQGAQRHAEMVKLKDGLDGQRYGFMLQSVPLGVDSNGKPYGAAVVKHNDMDPRPAKPPEPRGWLARAVMKIAREHLHAGGSMERDRLRELAAAIIDGERREYRADQSITGLLTKGYLFDAGSRHVSLTRTVQVDDNE